MEAASRGLVWFSISLGVAELTFTDAMKEAIGVKSEEASIALKLCGLCRIATGLAVVRGPQSRTPRWARVVADAIDLALLAAAATSPRNHRAKLAGASAAILGVALIDTFAASRVAPRGDVRRTTAVTILGSRADVEAAWSRVRDEKPTDHGELQLTDAPGGRGVEVRLLHGRGDGKRVEAKLRRFKSLVETGEIPTTVRQPAARAHTH